MIIFVTQKFTQTPRALADHLKTQNLDARVSTWPVGRLIRQATTQDLLVNWGVKKFEAPDEDLRVLNPGLDFNKFEALVRLHDAGVPVPRYWATPTDMRRELGNPRVKLVKQANSRHGGNGITVFTNTANAPALANFDANHYLLEFIDKIGEFRIHVAGDSVVAMSRKRAPDGTNPTNRDVWNYDNGYRFSPINETGALMKRALTNVAVGAVKALALDFGAVDIIMHPHGGLYVLEVNTAPSLEGERISAYAAYIATRNAAT